MDASTPQPHSWIVIQKLPTYTALIASVALIISVIHEFTYYLVVGFQYLSINTPSDYLRVALLWLPFTLISLAIGTFFGHQNSRAQDQTRLLAETTGLKRYVWQDKLSALFWSTALILVSIAGLSAFVGNPEKPLSLVLPLALIAALVAVFYAYRQGLRSKELSTVSISAYFIVGIGLTPPLRGVENGFRDLRSFEPVYNIRVSEGEQFPSVLMRALEKGVLLHQPGVGVRFIPWDHVRGLTRHVVLAPPRTLFEQVSQWFKGQSEPEHP